MPEPAEAEGDTRAGQQAGNFGKPVQSASGGAIPGGTAPMALASGPRAMQPQKQRHGMGQEINSTHARKRLTNPARASKPKSMAAAEPGSGTAASVWNA